MSSNSSNTAKQAIESETVDAEEPSMDEILASIKKIIADDENADVVLEDREQYTHPSDPSNSNQFDTEPDTVPDVSPETDLKTAMEIELENLISRDNVDDVESQQIEEVVQPVEQAPPVELEHKLDSAVSESLTSGILAGVAAVDEPKTEPGVDPSLLEKLLGLPAQDLPNVAEASQTLTEDPVNELAADREPVDAVVDSDEAVVRSEATEVSEPSFSTSIAVDDDVDEVDEPPVQLEAEPILVPSSEEQENAAEAPSPPSLFERAEQVRREVSESASGLSMDERLEKYRVRGRLRMESLATRPPAIEPAPPAPPIPVSPAIAAGPVLPTTDAIAQQMAATMMAEKEQEIEDLLSNIMRPTIQKWMGDNLPRLVEKLVREEIELVSRGQQAS